uniref:Transcription factor CBF/NF-Y/archaeal histone domain-containing protein n=1 Tax=Kalanchoe fedtschenkoi TaxID=63787 RepID=A0A7N0TS05_KALFE
MTGKRANPSSPPPSPTTDQTSSKDPDRLLPVANVSRLMKKSLPLNAKISKEAKETVQECVSEFISFITGEASDKCQREKRKTINGDDLLWAMTTLGFEDYVGPLKSYLSKYRELEGDKSAMAARQDQEADANGQMGVGDFDKVVNFGGNGRREDHDGHLGVEDFVDKYQYLLSANGGGGELHHGVQW